MKKQMAIRTEIFKTNPYSMFYSGKYAVRINIFERVSAIDAIYDGKYTLYKSYRLGGAYYKEFNTRAEAKKAAAKAVRAVRAALPKQNIHRADKRKSLNMAWARYCRNSTNSWAAWR